MRWRVTVATIAALAVLNACASGDSVDGEATSPSTATLIGSVVDVDGNLSTIDRFTLRTPDGSDMTLAVGDDASFDGGPMSHLRDHLRSGAPVIVEYTVDNGTNTAQRVADAGDR